jgi:DNA gyrase subunit B
MRQATSDMKVFSGAKDSAIEGRDLARALEQMVELNRYSEKLVRRLGNDERLLHLLLEAFGGRKGILRGEGVTLKSIFQEADGKLIARVEDVLAKAGYKTELEQDEEHGLWEIETVAAGGTKVKIDWELASHVEFQKTVEIHKTLEERLTAPFVIGENGSSETVESREELLERVLTSAKKDLTIQRYKGLGEMNPEKRTLLQVKIDDAVETDQIFTILMGDAVEPRRRFIEDNALDVKNLDV